MPEADFANISAKEVSAREEGKALASTWTLMDTHGIVLFIIASAPESTLKQISEPSALTERRVAQIVKDLVEVDMLRVTKVGRRNSYAVNPDARFRHPTLSHITLGQFLRILHEED